MLSTKWIFDFMDKKCFLQNALDSHIKLIRPTMLLSRQRVITRQKKNAEEVQQFFLSTEKWSPFLSQIEYKFVCTTIVSKRSSVKNIFHSSNQDLDESSRWLSASGIGRVELISLIKSLDFRYFGVFFFFSFLTVAQVIHPSCHCLHHCCIRTLLQVYQQA